MTYSDQQFGQELATQLDIGYDPLRIARWAYARFLEVGYDNTSSAVYDALIDLFTMEEDQQFHIPETELRAMAQRFMVSQ